MAHFLHFVFVFIFPGVVRILNEGWDLIHFDLHTIFSP